jgi:hypothetical protein
MEREPINSKRNSAALNPNGLLEALDLMELGIELKKQSILRDRPDLSPEKVLEEVQRWISSRSDDLSSTGTK